MNEKIILILKELKDDIKGSYHKLLNWIYDEVEILKIDDDEWTNFVITARNLPLNLGGKIDERRN